VNQSNIFWGFWALIETWLKIASSSQSIRHDSILDGIPRNNSLHIKLSWNACLYILKNGLDLLIKVEARQHLVEKRLWPPQNVLQTVKHSDCLIWLHGPGLRSTYLILFGNTLNFKQWRLSVEGVSTFWRMPRASSRPAMTNNSCWVMTLATCHIHTTDFKN